MNSVAGPNDCSGTSAGARRYWAIHNRAMFSLMVTPANENIGFLAVCVSVVEDLWRDPSRALTVLK